MNWAIKKKIKGIGLLTFTILLSGFLQGQIAPEKYWIQFTDKNNSPYSVNNPSVFLSQRAIDRRNFHGVAVTEQDFPVNPSYVQGVLASGQITVLNSSRWMNGLIIQTTDTLGLQAVMALPYVDSAASRFVETPGLPGENKFPEDYITFELEEPFTPNQEALDYGLAQGQAEMIHINTLHDLGYTGNGMIIAVMDAGYRGADTLDILQPLWTNGQILGGWDFVANAPMDYTSHSYHGTHVMNCMGANVPGKYIGTAPDAQYWLLRTEDGPTENIIEEYNWVCGAEFADSAGADVFNTSLGYTTFDDTAYNHSYEDMDGNTTIITIGADIAASKGILVVNSAGNSGGNSWYYIGAPADGDSVLAIGAVRDDRLLAGFSSRGPSYDGRVKPNVCALGEGVPMPLGDDSAYYINGTSFSGPITAGAVACLWQARSGYTNMEVYHAIEESAHLGMNPDDDYGYGIPNFGLAYYLITSVEEAKTASLDASVYPNPARNEAMVYTTGKVDQVSVVSISGVQVFPNTVEIRDNGVYLGIDNLSPGMYLVNLQNGSENVVYRLMVR